MRERRSGSSGPARAIIAHEVDRLFATTDALTPPPGMADRVRARIELELDRRDGADALLHATRELEPPPFAHERTLARIEAARPDPRLAGVARGQWRWSLAVPALAVVSIAAALGGVLRAPSATPTTVRVVSASGARLASGRALGQEITLPARLETYDDGHAKVTQGRTELTLGARSAAELRDGHVSLSRGGVRIAGRGVIEAPGCSVEVDGIAEATILASAVQITAIAGSVEQTPASTVCHFVVLGPPATGGVRGARGGAVAAGGSEPALAGSPATNGIGEEGSSVASPESPTASSDSAVSPARRPTDDLDATGAVVRGARRRTERTSRLAEELDAHRATLDAVRRDPEGAVAAWRRLRRAFPRGQLAHEIDVQVIAALLARGNLTEARREAAHFVRRHPASPRRAEMEALVRGAE